jgi:hypothetical protein
MREILTIVPTMKEPGLVAYECRRCGHKTSILCGDAPKTDGRAR